MIETVTAVMGLVSAGIFLAHAFEGYRSRAWFDRLEVRVARPVSDRKLDPWFRPGIRKALINSDEHLSGRCIMRNHDTVSNGFLALTTASFVLLCSSLLAFAFG